MIRRRCPLNRKWKVVKARTPKAADNLAYLAWIRQQGCVVCRAHGLKQVSRTEAAHVGRRGLLQRCSDFETLPLCTNHHRTGKDSHHSIGKFFWDHHQLDRTALIAEFRREYSCLSNTA
jgi:hypothetical protein